MPLSEHEQKLLEQLEKQLHEDDPKFANSMGSDPGRNWSTRHIVMGVLAPLPVFSSRWWAYHFRTFLLVSLVSS